MTTRDAEYCAICMVVINGGDIRTLACNHSFHTACFAQWSFISTDNGVIPSCPCCRQTFVDPLDCYRQVEILYCDPEIISPTNSRLSIEFNNFSFVLLTIIILQASVIYIQLKSEMMNYCI